MNPFFAKRSELDPAKYMIFDYFFESTMEPAEAAAHLAQEQSTAQWKRVGVDEDFRPEFAAKIVDLEVERVLTSSAYPILKGGEGKAYACRVKMAYPIKTVGAKLPNILTVAAGEGAFFSPGITLIKLFDIEFPETFLEEFEGPKFGIEGLRELLGVFDRPILFGVIKPNIGLPPEPFTELAYQAWLGGLDIAKDDEMLFDTEWSPLAARSRLLGEACRKATKETGEKKIYLANITDEVDRLIELHDSAVDGGAGALMVNGMTTGLSAVRMLRKHTKVPLVGHFDFIASMTRMPYFGLSTKLLTKLQRLAGFDAIVMPGFSERMKTPEFEVELNVEECLKPFGHIKRSLPVPGGSDWAGTLLPLYKRLKTVDFGFCPGRGVFGHPSGPKAGAMSLRQAWNAGVANIPLETYAKTHPELASAIEAFA